MSGFDRTERHFAKEILRARRVHALTQEEVAARLRQEGVEFASQSSVSRLEQGQRRPTMSEAMAFARILHLPDVFASTRRVPSGPVILPWAATSPLSGEPTLQRVIWAASESLKRASTALYDLGNDSEPYAPSGAARALVALDGFERYAGLVLGSELRDRLREIADSGGQVDQSEPVVASSDISADQTRPSLRALRELLDSVVVHDSPSVETGDVRLHVGAVDDTVGGSTDAAGSGHRSPPAASVAEDSEASK